MSLSLAFEHFLQSLSGLSWLKVETELMEPGSESFRLTVIPGTPRTERYFGARRITMGLQLIFDAKDGSDPGDIAERLDLIEEAIFEDRRRGGSSQTTIDNDSWQPEEYQGREGLRLRTETAIVVYGKVNT